MQPNATTEWQQKSDTFCNVKDIHGFKELFWPTRTLVTSLRFGSTLLLSGAPGAGKTTFALATVRAMMAKASSVMRERAREKTPPDYSNVCEEQTDVCCKIEKTIAYYVSSEVDVERLDENFNQYEWFERANEAGNADFFKFRIDDPSPDATNFYCIAPMLEVDRPVPSPEELVNSIFNRIAHTLTPSEAPEEGAKIYVIIDSITALLKGCEQPGEERRQTHEIMRRLKGRFEKRNLALIVLLAEQDHRSLEQAPTMAVYGSTQPSVEDYLADIVFRLYTRNMPLGRRARILEVVKSQGANMALGEHTWQIISHENVEAILQGKNFQNEIRHQCFQHLTGKNAPASSQWGGVIIFPRPQLAKPPKDVKSTETAHNTKEETGKAPGASNGGPDDRTRTVEVELRSNASKVDGEIGQPGASSRSHNKDESRSFVEAWEGNEADAGSVHESVPASGTIGLNLNVEPGTVTLIAGPMGSGKSTLCRQFLQKKPDTPTVENSRVLISFEIASAEEVSNPLPEDKTFTTLRFTQSRFDLNVLVGHINWILDNGCKRLAFDGLSEWITTFEKPEASRLLEVLMKTVRQKRQIARPSVFMTYEMPLQEDPLAPAAMGAEADNVVAIRKVPINDELRSVIYVLKRKHGGEGDRQDADMWPTILHPAELLWKEKDGQLRLEVDPTSLEAFTGLLNRAGQVSPARVLIQLFAENKAEQEFNRQLEKQLKSEFKQRVDLTFSHFSLSEIGSTLETAFGAGKPSEAFNLAIHAVDEWWLKAEQTTKFLRPLRKQKLTGGPDYRDFWWWEIEKGLSRGDHKSWRAVPAYLDFAMFCVNPAAMTEEARVRYFRSKFSKLKRTLSGKRNQWKCLLANIPRVWARPSADKEWFAVDVASSDTVLEFALAATGQQKTRNLDRKAVFYFDSSTRETCSCMFFELVWALGATESFLADNSAHNRNAAERAMAFLQFLVIEGLMPARSSIQPLNYNGEPILFSRHWYSTLRRCSEEKPPSAKRRRNSGVPDRGTLVALPFMPLGVSGTNAVALLNDIAVCHNRWLERAKVYCNGDFGRHQIEKLDEDTGGKIPIAKKVNNALSSYKASREWLLEMSGGAKNSDRDFPASPESIAGATCCEGDDAAKRDSGARGQKCNDEDFPNNWTAGLDDLIEIASWGALRLQLLFGEKGRFPLPDQQTGTIFDALHEARWVRHSLPDLAHLETKFKEENVVATGYVCSGSWMYGVDRKSRSSEIQAQILSALTSLDNAERRAEAGAGMSARKDFFYVKGDQPAKGMEYLHWRELLRYSAARTRRRDWVLAPTNNAGEEDRTALNNPTELYSTIQGEMLNCLRLADLHRQEYAKYETADHPERKKIISTLLEQAKAAVAEIYGKALEKKAINSSTPCQ